MKFNKTTLENGLRVITVPMKDSLTATVLILVEAGSKYEVREINGLSHFLEHMCFKGTQKRPKAIDIASELDGIGAEYNAFTSLEYTGYYAKAEPGHLNKILDVVSDIYLNQIFEAEEINRERGVIIEEMNATFDSPRRHIGHLWHELLYGDQPAGWDILGKKNVIQKLIREDFLKYRSEHYLAQSTIVIVAGKINEDKIINDLKNIFGGIRNGSKTPKVKTAEKQEKPEILLKHKETDQAHLVLGARAFDVFDKRRHALEVLADILGGGMSSRLFQKIREEMGAAYYVGADVDLYTDHGYLAAAAGVDNKRIDLVIGAIIKEFERLVKEPVKKEELERAKEHLVGGLMLGLESSDSLASFYGGQEVIMKEMISPEELAKKIRAVKDDEIQAVAREIFQNKKLNLAIIGPFKEKERFEKILNLE
jgi:predicted Zn-dependent peptidase